jgi:hypothetical protein
LAVVMTAIMRQPGRRLPTCDGPADLLVSIDGALLGLRRGTSTCRETSATQLNSISQSISNRSTEEEIPEIGRNAEITLLPPIVMMRVTQLGTVKERSAIYAVAMNSSMDKDIPEVSKHQTARKSTCHIQARLQPKRNKHAEREGADARPNWSTYQRARSRMVRLMHLCKHWDAMKYKSMNEVLNECPRGDSYKASD